MSVFFLQIELIFVPHDCMNIAAVVQIKKRRRTGNTELSELMVALLTETNGSLDLDESSLGCWATLAIM